MLYASLEEVYQGYTPLPKKKKSKEKKNAFEKREDMSDLRDGGVGGMISGVGVSGVSGVSGTMEAEMFNKKLGYNNEEFDMDIPTTVKTSPNHMVKGVKGQTCTLSAAPYTYPIQPEAMKEYKEAVEVSLNYDQNQIVKSSLNTLRSYNEDDLDQYFDIDPSGGGSMELKSADAAAVQHQNKYPPKGVDIPQQKDKKRSSSSTDEQQSLPDTKRKNNKKGKKGRKSDEGANDDDKMYEFLLFVFIGFIIIALCEILVSIVSVSRL